MHSSLQAVFGRARHFWIEGAVGSAITLTLVGTASACLPPAPAAKPAATHKVAIAPPPAAPPAPAPVFACGEPVPGHEIDSPYGLRRLPWERAGRLHEGIDISANAGEPVLAVADGIIVKAGTSPSYGRFVEVRHGDTGLSSFYAHLGKIDRGAMEGAQISKGAVLGRIGSSGTSTGPHLHFEIRRDGKALNPQAFIDREFATKADLPIKAASYVPRHVRVAQVSSIPQSKRALMDAAPGAPKDGRVHTVLIQVATAD